MTGEGRDLKIVFDVDCHRIAYRVFGAGERQAARVDPARGEPDDGVAKIFNIDVAQIEAKITPRRRVCAVSSSNAFRRVTMRALRTTTWITGRVLLILFTETREVAEHDLLAWFDRCLKRGYPVASPAARGFPTWATLPAGKDLAQITRARGVLFHSDAVQGVGIPFHPGAERFYKEAGLLKG